MEWTANGLQGEPAAFVRAVGRSIVDDLLPGMSETDKLCVYALVKCYLKKFLGMYFVRVEFDDKQMGFFIMMRDAHHASMIPDGICDSGALVMIY